MAKETPPRPFSSSEVNHLLDLIRKDVSLKHLLDMPNTALDVAREAAPVMVEHHMLKKPALVWKAITMLYDAVPDAAAACGRDLLHGLSHIDALWEAAGADSRTFRSSLLDDVAANMQVLTIKSRLNMNAPEFGETYGKLSTHSHRLFTYEYVGLTPNDYLQIPAATVLLISFYVARAFDHHATLVGLRDFAERLL